MTFIGVFPHEPSAWLRDPFNNPERRDAEARSDAQTPDKFVLILNKLQYKSADQKSNIVPVGQSSGGRPSGRRTTT
jgi:hypothetical protein